MSCDMVRLWRKPLTLDPHVFREARTVWLTCSDKVCLNHPTTPAVWRFGAARRVVERSIEAFPKQEWVDEAYYQVALYDEKNGNDERTMKGYRRFLKKS